MLVTRLHRCKENVQAKHKYATSKLAVLRRVVWTVFFLASSLIEMSIQVQDTERRPELGGGPVVPPEKGYVVKQIWGGSYCVTTASSSLTSLSLPEFAKANASEAKDKWDLHDEYEKAVVDGCYNDLLPGGNAGSPIPQRICGKTAGRRWKALS